MKITPNCHVVIVAVTTTDGNNQTSTSTYVRGVKVGSVDANSPSDFSQNAPQGATVEIVVNGIAQIEKDLTTPDPNADPLVDNFGSVYFLISN